MKNSNIVTVICNEEHVIVRGVCVFCERDALQAELLALKQRVDQGEFADKAPVWLRRLKAGLWPLRR